MPKVCINIEKINNLSSALSANVKHKTGKMRLVSKADYVSCDRYANFESEWGNLPGNADSFSYVKMNKISDNSFEKEIMTYYDNLGRLIKRIFRTNGLNTKKHEYTYQKIGRTIDYYDGEGKKLSTELQIMRRWADNSPKRLLTKRINFLTDENNNLIREIIFTRFPKCGEPQEIESKKVASAKLCSFKNKKFLFDFKTHGFEKSFEPSRKDKFLLLRFLDPRSDEGLKYFTKELLKKKNLDNLRIKILPNSNSVSDNSMGYFSVWDRIIAFSPKIKEKVTFWGVNIAAHETEHAYQYAQIGRAGRGKTSYETDAYKYLGDLSNLDEIFETVKYANARFDYPRLSDTEDLTKNFRYMNNYLEVKAREAGEKMAEAYRNSNVNNYMFFDCAFD